MLKKRLLILLLSALFLFAGCQQGNTPNSDTDNTPQDEQKKEISFEVRTYDENDGYKKELDVVEYPKQYPAIDKEHKYTYTNKLTKPDSTVHTFADLCNNLDYYAFYYTPTFELTLADDYIYFTGTEKNIDKEMNAAYWGESLINGVMGMDHSLEGNKLTITYTFYDANSIAYPASSFNARNLAYRQVDYKSDLTFVTDDKTRPLCDVSDSQQLYYAAEHKYQVNPLPDSRAEFIYSYCKTLLNKIISPEMTYMEKVYAIYDYIENNCTYDASATDPAKKKTPDNPDKYPDQYCSTQMCYYIEGCLFNKVCVCDGYAKTMSLLCNMIGLDVFRVNGSQNHEYISRRAVGHAYNFVKYDGKWYFCCPTWGQSANETYGTRCNSDALMTAYERVDEAMVKATRFPDEIDASTVADKFDDNIESIRTLKKDRFQKKTIKVTDGDPISCYITSKEQFMTIYKLVEKRNLPGYVTVYIDSKEMKQGIWDDINQSTDNARYDFISEKICEYDVYECLIMNIAK